MTKSNYYLQFFLAFLKKITTTKSSHFLSPNGQGLCIAPKTYIFFSGQSTDMKYYGLTKPKEKKQGLKVIRLKRHSRLERWNSKTKGHHRGVGPARPRSYLDFAKQNTAVAAAAAAVAGCRVMMVLACPGAGGAPCQLKSKKSDILWSLSAIHTTINNSEANSYYVII